MMTEAVGEAKKMELIVYAIVCDQEAKQWQSIRLMGATLLLIWRYSVSEYQFWLMYLIV
jgi:hypothetical protein